MLDIKGRHIHFIGIGGIGMSAVAQIYLKMGAKISGSDAVSNSATEKLKEMGVKVSLGHKNTEDAKVSDLIVFSGCIDDNNPEIIAARKKHITLLHRAQALSDLAARRKTVAVTGAHGKTTTTALISQVFVEAGLDPTIALGGECRNFGGNARAGEGEYFICEADESDGSFLYLRPDFSVITNIDREHLDYYRDFSDIIEHFRKYIFLTKKSGAVFYPCNDRRLAQIIRDYGGRSISFDFKGPADIFAADVKIDKVSSNFDCIYRNNRLGRINLPLAGRHNISNALCALAVGLEAAVEFGVISEALSRYRGVKRRFGILRPVDGIMVIDDYAHHPTEIRATLSAAFNLGAERLIAVFQPHRFTRTKFLKDDFADALFEARHIVITDIYAASEKPIPGVSARDIFLEIEKRGHRNCRYVPKNMLVEYLSKTAKYGDAIVMLGAGDIGKLAMELNEKLKTYDVKEQSAL